MGPSPGEASGDPIQNTDIGDRKSKMRRKKSKHGRTASLSEVHESVPVPTGGSWWRHWLALTGPALMVAVGYMDPGNWATDIEGGSRYNYALIWVLLMSNLMAVLLQSLAARLGIVNRRDLAQACHEEYPPLVNIPLYVLAEIAITATDLAEVIGSAIAFQLLFGLPLLWGVVLTTLDVLLLLLLSRYGIRKLEAVVIALVGTIGVGFLIEIALSQPEWSVLAGGFVPTIPDRHALYVSIGILGATVMPHNLYLHSSLVQTRKIPDGERGTRRAIFWNTVDSAVALNLAFFVNAAILVMAAAVFYRNQHYDVVDIQDAHHLLEPILGAAIAPFAFAVALLASGQSSTITGTLAGQIVMEGYLNLRIRPWLRRLLTRLLAVIPAIAVILAFGEGSTGRLLVLSQVILSLQLPFAVIPLIHFVADRRRMGKLAIAPWVQVLAWIVAGVIVALNVKLVWDEITAWLSGGGGQFWIVKAVALLLTGLLGMLLLYVTFRPWLDRARGIARSLRPTAIHPQEPSAQVVPASEPYRRVAVAVDFSGRERDLLTEALRLVSRDTGQLVLLHVVESPVAMAVGEAAADRETQSDEQRLAALTDDLRRQGYDAEWRLGSGNPNRELARMIDEIAPDLLVVGGHGHRGVSDLLRGATIDALRHRLQVPVLVVPLQSKSKP